MGVSSKSCYDLVTKVSLEETLKTMCGTCQQIMNELGNSYRTESLPTYTILSMGLSQQVVSKLGFFTVHHKLKRKFNNVISTLSTRHNLVKKNTTGIFSEDPTWRQFSV